MSIESIIKAAEGQRVIMRIEIDGRWSVAEIADFLRYTEDLYNIALFLLYGSQDYLSSVNYYRWHLMNAIGYIEGQVPSGGFDVYKRTTDNNGYAVLRFGQKIRPAESLTLKGIKYRSKGFADVAGLGEVIGHVKDFFLKIIELVVSRKDRNLERQTRALENEQIRVEVAESYIDLAEKCGFSDEEKEALLREILGRGTYVGHLVEEGQVTDVAEASPNETT